ncbi:uncharacterized protein [Haliotis cracherodii]|uniref:uncharacterized protein isoform X1 n=2 Tax=Haliotis cracherodii TaxID=6455 RepID=UPI0039EC846B
MCSSVGDTMLTELGFLVFFTCSALSWDPDAGVVVSFTKRPGAKAIASSNQDKANLVIDSKDSTHWTSEPCLPMNYINNKDLNVLFNACQEGRCTTSTGSTSVPSATDANWKTVFKAGVSNGQAEIHIRLNKDTPLKLVSLQGKFHGPTTLTVDHGNDHKTIKVLSPQDDYQKETLALNNASALGISLTSSQSFSLEEIGALGQQGCVDRLVIDLGSVETLGSIRVRSWPGEETYYSRLMTSLDMTTWYTVTDIDPKLVNAQYYKIDPPVQARYVAIEHDIHDKDWVKSFVWELDAFGTDGAWGPPPTPKPNPDSFHQMFGVNGIWGWGLKGQVLHPGQGAFLYSQVASHARNYHQIGWDIAKLGDRAGYDNMAQGHGTSAKSWVNWDTEYGIWVKANLSIDVSIQFKADKYPPNLWTNPQQEAYQFGKDFAAHFGPTKGNGLVTAAEVGNEPWDYLHDFYATILEGMAKGLKDGDPGIKVLPAALQSFDKTAENPPWHANYIGTRVTEAIAPYIDVLNEHVYSFVTKPNGTRILSYPEDHMSEFNGMKSMVRWRDVNMPNTPVWITEYGWDSPGAGETCTYSECVSERAAALYGIRALLIMARMGIQRATWFYFENHATAECPQPRIFCRSGLTGSKEVNFAKKKVFDIHKAFLDYVGNTHFLQVVKEDNDAYVYLLGDMKHGSGSPMATHVVAWRPINGDDMSSQSVSLYLRAHPKSAKYITPDGLTTAPTPSSSGGHWVVSLKSEPIIVEVNSFAVSGGVSPVG